MPNVPKRMFFTRGKGVHKEKLASFEAALRDAQIAHLNLVSVSSIFPPGCKKVSLATGLTNEHRRRVVASVGLAIPRNPELYGYLSEHHAYGQTQQFASDYAEDLAAAMLATTLGVPKREVK